MEQRNTYLRLLYKCAFSVANATKENIVTNTWSSYIRVLSCRFSCAGREWFWGGALPGGGFVIDCSFKGGEFKTNKIYFNDFSS